MATFGWWAETIQTTAASWGHTVAEKTKLVLSCNTGAALFGVFAAITRFAGYEYQNPLGEVKTQILGCAAYALLICYLMWDSKSAK